ncbi:flagellar brake domain-containing protein [Clostridium sp. KNHs214]|uniref:flagellar brake protein n=1 Tax=Clostridium sp. KNHs214 TaxID=1540257 RepID=UPI00054E920E|nr:flagellar brake domain-containing protein [Clostridium sp. KNHs214]
MRKLEIKLNNKIKIKSKDGEYSSNVQDVSNECISISIPVRQGSYLFLREDDLVEAVYYDHRELYHFKSKVLRREVGKIPVIVIEKPLHYKKIQRRNYVRIDHVLEAYYTLLEKGTKNSDLEIFFRNNRNKLQKAIIADLSGGGCRLKVEKKLEYGNKIFLRIPIYSEEMNLICKVVREDEKENNLYIYGVSFSSIQESSREKLIKYVFEIIRQQRKRALKR